MGILPDSRADLSFLDKQLDDLLIRGEVTVNDFQGADSTRYHVLSSVHDRHATLTESNLNPVPSANNVTQSGRSVRTAGVFHEEFLVFCVRINYQKIEKQRYLLASAPALA